jgi:hypothetical protein
LTLLVSVFQAGLNKLLDQRIRYKPSGMLVKLNSTFCRFNWIAVKSGVASDCLSTRVTCLFLPVSRELPRGGGPRRHREEPGRVENPNVDRP